MRRLLLATSALAMVAFWVVALTTDWAPKAVLVVLLLAGAPSVVEPVYRDLLERRSRGRS